MKENKKRKPIAIITLGLGIILFIAALVIDCMGLKLGFRGPMLILGIVGTGAGAFIYPTPKNHRKIVNVVFLFPLLFCFVVTVIIPLVLGLFYSLLIGMELK